MLEALTIKDSEKFLRQKSKIVDFSEKDLRKSLFSKFEYKNIDLEGVKYVWLSYSPNNQSWLCFL